MGIDSRDRFARDFVHRQRVSEVHHSHFQMLFESRNANASDSGCLVAKIPIDRLIGIAGIPGKQVSETVRYMTPRLRLAEASSIEINLKPERSPNKT